MSKQLEPTIPGVICAFLLALLSMVLWPVVWAMRGIGRAGERLSRWKESR